jgi:hypothetical protein
MALLCASGIMQSHPVAHSSSRTYSSRTTAAEYLYRMQTSGGQQPSPATSILGIYATIVSWVFRAGMNLVNEPMRSHAAMTWSDDELCDEPQRTVMRCVMSRYELHYEPWRAALWAVMSSVLWATMHWWVVLWAVMSCGMSRDELHYEPWWVVFWALESCFMSRAKPLCA